MSNLLQTLSSIMLIVISVALFFATQEYKTIRNEAAQTECAQYNPVSGDFEWIEK